MTLRIFLTALALALVSGCATIDTYDPNYESPDPRPRPKKQAPAPRPKSRPTPESAPEATTIDLNEIQQQLKIHRPVTELGFTQKKFDLCQLGHKETCGRQYFSLIHFQIVCRDSEGTVEYVSEAELEPLAHREIQWKLGNNEGTLQTDHQGYGQIRTATLSPVGDDRLMLINGRLSLGLSASEVTRLMVPKNWCQR